MRKIDTYQLKPEYIMGDTTNLLILKEKMEKDTLLLNEIEIDYNQNQNEYKKEYVDAKINHLKNKQAILLAFLKTVL